jgi:hypothetical protein
MADVPRTKDGKWVKGHSPNPGGRPKGYREVVEICRAETVASVRTLIAIRDNEEAAEATRVLAANSILDRGWGKPTQPIDMDPENREVGDMSREDLLAIVASGRDKTV